MHVSRIENSLRRAGGPSASARATECRRTELAVMLDLTCVRLRNRRLKVGPGAPSLGDSPSGIRRRHSPPGSAVLGYRDRLARKVVRLPPRWGAARPAWTSATARSSWWCRLGCIASRVLDCKWLGYGRSRKPLHRNAFAIPQHRGIGAGSAPGWQPLERARRCPFRCTDPLRRVTSDGYQWGGRPRIVP